MGRVAAFSKIVAALLFGASASVVAAEMAALAPAPKVDVAAVAKLRSEVLALGGQPGLLGKRPAAARTASGAQPAGEVAANPFRTYPPSCLESPVPFGLYANDPFAQQAPLLLGGDPLSSDASEQAYGETVTVTLFRVVCSSGKSATLLEIDRPCDPSCGALYPVFPGVTVPLTDGSNFPIRLTDDPNTFFGTTYAGAPLFTSDVFVLENYFNSNATQLDYNQAFTMDIQNLLSGGFFDSHSFTLGAYNPSQYSEASQPLKISGYMTTTWTNPNQSGEGIFLQVYDVDGVNRTMSFAWFTYDTLHLPFWLFGQTNSFAIGSRTMTATTAYLQGGVFSPGTPSPSVPFTIWGSVTFTFPDCNTMNIAYTGNADAVAGPTGSGSRIFTRVGNINSLTCD